ncbi:MAG: ABC transporter permease [Ktedonobacterales bacterium]
MADLATTRPFPKGGGRAAAVAWFSTWSYKALLIVASLPFLLFLLVPLVALIVHAPPAQLLAQLSNPMVGQALQLSLVTTLWSLGITLLFGTPLAYLLARGGFPGKTVLDTLLDLPIVMPPAVAGIALLITFGRFGLLGRWLNLFGVDIAFTPVAVIMAQTFVAAPFYIKTAEAAFAGVSREVQGAAAIDGAGPFGVFRHITVPLCSAALAGGLLMTWARALGEFGATIIFAGNLQGVTQTMPLAIYLGFEYNLDSAITLSLVLLIVSFAVLLLVRVALRQRLATITDI